MTHWLNDKDLEKAMIQSSIVFLKTKTIDKREHLLQKYILSLLFSKTIKKIDDIITEFNITHPNVYIDKEQIQSALDILAKENFISHVKYSNISLDPEKFSEVQRKTDEIQNQLTNIINYIFLQVKNNFKKSIDNDNQVKENIKSCLNYYFKIASLSYFDIDSHRDINELSQLSQIASEGINGNSELRDQIIYEIGKVINSPDDTQIIVLETLARIHVTAQIMNLDPLLSNFKATHLRGKKFILDTDVVLHAITDNASHSKQYKMMIKQLESCGCQIYIPGEIVQEVYNHAEASTKRYSYVSNIIGINNEEAPKQLKNIFLEDYHYTILKDSSKSYSWEKYIKNFYDPRYGICMTTDVIQNTLGEKINYQKLPSCGKLNEENKERLYNAVLEETKKTDKAIHREFEKNEDISTADTLLYLTAIKINEEANISGPKNNSESLLMKNCYILSNSNRVHYCASKLGLSSNVICNPRALIAYLAEIGFISRDEVQYTKLFDNPFLIYTSKLIESDLDAILDSHIDLKDVNMVRLKYELEEEIHKILTVKDSNEFVEIYKNVKQKGYQFTPEIEQIMEKNKDNDDKIKLLTEIIEKKNMIINKQSAEIAIKEQKIGELQYYKRIGASPNQKNKKKK